MKIFFTCGILILLFSTDAVATSATVHITVKNFSGSITVYNPELRYDLTKNKMAPLHIDAHQSSSYAMAINKPTYLILYFSSNKYFNYSFFLTPGDELFVTADFTGKGNNITVTGKGAKNNQPEIFALTNMDTKPFNDDVTPYRVIAAINKRFFINKSILENYIKVNKPSPAFIKAATNNLQYFAPKAYYESSHYNAFGKPENQQRVWQKIQDSLFSKVKLSNDDALTAYNYTQLIDNFMIREPYKLWKEYQTHPALFYKQWFHTTPVRGKMLFNGAPTGILSEKVVDNYFSGQVAEYAYCQALNNEFREADYASAISIFDHFKKKYPTSVYIKGFSAPVADIVNKQQRTLNNRIVFFKDNGTMLNTFKDVLAFSRGKVVFIDMWGTWCGPCREEMEKNNPQLRAHFKGKNVTFLYIANHDVGQEKAWKKLIAYFQLEGEHILANPQLTGDIMAKVKSTGYPTYIIVKKDGSYKQTETKYPVNTQALIKEIEAATL